MSIDHHLTDDDADFLAYFVTLGTENRHAIDAEHELVPAVAALIDRHDSVYGVYADIREIGGYGFLAIKTGGTDGNSNTALLCDNATQAATWLAMLGDLREETASRIADWRSRGLADHQIDEMITAAVIASAKNCDGSTVESLLREAVLVHERLSPARRAN